MIQMTVSSRLVAFVGGTALLVLALVPSVCTV